MIIREYQPADCKALAALFYNTVHTINAKDYTKEQLNAWAPKQMNLEAWNQSLREHYSVVAIDESIVGFGDIDKTGYLDRLYVHAAHQGKGIATAICNELEQAAAAAIITTHASITARPFFERRGYKAVKEQQVIRNSIVLTNYLMEKKRCL